MGAKAMIQPKLLRECLENGVNYSKQAHPINPTILVSITTEPASVVVQGFTRYSAIRDTRPARSAEGAGSVLLDYGLVSTAVKDVLKATRGPVEGFASADTVVEVVLDSESLTIKTSGGQSLVTLRTPEWAVDGSPDAWYREGYEILADHFDNTDTQPVRSFNLRRDVTDKLKATSMSVQGEKGAVKTMAAEDVIGFSAINEQVLVMRIGTAEVLQVSAGGIIELEGD